MSNLRSDVLPPTAPYALTSPVPLQVDDLCKQDPSSKLQLDEAGQRFIRSDLPAFIQSLLSSSLPDDFFGDRICQSLIPVFTLIVRLMNEAGDGPMPSGMLQVRGATWQLTHSTIRRSVDGGCGHGSPSDATRVPSAPPLHAEHGPDAGLGLLHRLLLLALRARHLLPRPHRRQGTICTCPTPPCLHCPSCTAMPESLWPHSNGPFSSALLSLSLCLLHQVALPRASQYGRSTSVYTIVMLDAFVKAEGPSAIINRFAVAPLQVTHAFRTHPAEAKGL